MQLEEAFPCVCGKFVSESELSANWGYCAECVDDAFTDDDEDYLREP